MVNTVAPGGPTHDGRGTLHLPCHACPRRGRYGRLEAGPAFGFVLLAARNQSTSVTESAASKLVVAMATTGYVGGVPMSMTVVNARWSSRAWP
ncbi:MAG: hypothetical protein QOG97_175 [Acidimicrobiaceae bacterium]|nr:hypothetical protein [Acidimicrobiaceae bacterium]